MAKSRQSGLCVKGLATSLAQRGHLTMLVFRLTPTRSIKLALIYMPWFILAV